MLLNPPGTEIWFRDGYCSSSSKSGYCWHPLDLLVQSGILAGRGHEVALVDAIALSLTAEQTLSRIQAFKPDAVIALAGDVSWPEDVRFFRRLSNARHAPRLMLSGDVPRFESDKAFAEIPALEAVITDFITPAAALLLEEGAQAAKAAGGIHLRGCEASPLAGRTWSSAPARHDLLTRAPYRLPFHGAEPFASVLSSYGCPFACSFCNTGRLKYVLRPVAEVVDEVRMVQRLGYKRMYLRDATANGRRSALLELCHALAAEPTQLAWNTFCTFKPFDAELAQAMAAAGCEVVQFGIETESAELRAATGKPFDNDAARAAVRYSHEAGMRVCGHFVLGLPGQDEADVKRSSQFARDLELDYASFNLASARPGTPLRDTAGALAGGDASKDGFIEGLADVSGDRLRALKRQAVLRFYLRPRPLRAMAPDLRTRAGWRHVLATVKAAVNTL